MSRKIISAATRASLGDGEIEEKRKGRGRRGRRRRKRVGVIWEPARLVNKYKNMGHVLVIFHPLNSWGQNRGE